MKWMTVALVALSLASWGWGEESTGHQRVAVVKTVDHHWEAGLGISLLPWAPAAWDLTVSPSLSYEYQRAWSARVGIPYHWLSPGPGLPLDQGWEDLRGSLGWRTAEGEPRWRVDVSAEGPAVPGSRDAPWRGTLGCGLSLVRDPVVLGWSLWATRPLDAGQAETGDPVWTGGAALSFQEVVNDSLAWSLSFSPRVAALGTDLSWSVAVSLGVGWFDGPFSLSADTDAGSGQPWGLSTSTAVNW